MNEITTSQTFQPPVWVQMAGCQISAQWVQGITGNDKADLRDERHFKPDAVGPETRPIFLYRNSVDTMIRAMEDGVPPETALASWIDAVESFIGLVRQMRSRMVLIEATAAEANPAKASEVLGFVPQDTQPEPRALYAPNELFVLLAEHLVAQSPIARRLGAELRASAVPILGQNMERRVDVDELFAETKKTAPVRDTKKEQAERQAAHDAMNALQSKLDTLQSKLDAKDGEKRLSDKEIKRLNAQLLDMQQELESHFISAATANQDLAQKRLDCQNLQAEIAQIMGSKSWRITRPLREFRRIVFGD